MKGAIISAYPCVGKSTFANATNGYIDLESGNFWVGVERDEYWHKVYCNLAIHFAKQGYRVFVASHEIVRSYLASLPADPELLMVACFPAKELEAEWINKLFKRYLSNMSAKDRAAWERACRKFGDDIDSLANQERFEKIVINDMRYDLGSMLDELFERQEEAK